MDSDPDKDAGGALAVQDFNGSLWESIMADSVKPLPVASYYWSADYVFRAAMMHSHTMPRAGQTRLRFIRSEIKRQLIADVRQISGHDAEVVLA